MLLFALYIDKGVVQWEREKKGFHNNGYSNAIGSSDDAKGTKDYNNRITAYERYLSIARCWVTRFNPHLSNKDLEG